VPEKARAKRLHQVPVLVGDIRSKINRSKHTSVTFLLHQQIIAYIHIAVYSYQLLKVTVQKAKW
jgi:hypothetical protein